jgi:6-pyruvoyltetrahydropterin/6-carboxytetrahydropterin synthase
MSENELITESDLKYIDPKGNLLRSRTELSVANILKFLDVDYEYDSKVKLNDGSVVIVDFRTKMGLIEVIDNEEDAIKMNKISTNSVEKIIALGNSKHAGTISEINSFFSYDNLTSDIRSIFIEDPTLNFDYAHTLPMVEECSVLHGHTSSVMVEIIGPKNDGMVIDFGDAKKIVKRALNMIDHKFFINRKYLVEEDVNHYRVSFAGPKGTFDIKVPKQTAYVLNDEATVENLAGELLKNMAPMMPKNVQALGVYVYEGVSKGAHIISNIKDYDSRKM